VKQVRIRKLTYSGLGSSIEEMFGVNYERLVLLKTKYDPSNMFGKYADFTALK
jgi:hypothetical protein